MSLPKFLKQPENSRSRERIFFHKLCFDLELAAARRDYALSIFEPEVDRDGFDIVLDDADNLRHIQVKTVLKSAKTAKWKSTIRFLRPTYAYGTGMGMAPADCGAGGGFILMEIDDGDHAAGVSYLYTDYFLLKALSLGLIHEKTKPVTGHHSRQAVANEVLTQIQQGRKDETILLPWKAFLQVKSPDSLLAIAGLHSCDDSLCYLPADKVQQVSREQFAADALGVADVRASQKACAIADAHAEAIFKLLDEPTLCAYSA